MAKNAVKTRLFLYSSSVLWYTITIKWKEKKSMAPTAKDQLIMELKDMLHSQQKMNQTLQTALDNSNAQIKLLNEQLEYLKKSSLEPQVKKQKDK